jgi:dipeptidase E
MRLFLTSDSFRNLSTEAKKEFWNLVGKEPQTVRVAFIPTANFIGRDPAFIETTYKYFYGMGIQQENISQIELDHNITLEDIKSFDILYLDGGNSFYLLQKTLESGFDKAVTEYLKKDLGVYVGVSAGTILAGPDIEIAEPYDDKSKAALENTKGLCLTPSAFNPHFQDEDQIIIDQYQSKVSYPIKPLRDGEAVISTGSIEKIIK